MCIGNRTTCNPFMIVDQGDNFRWAGDTKGAFARYLTTPRRRMPSSEKMKLSQDMASCFHARCKSIKLFSHLLPISSSPPPQTFRSCSFFSRLERLSQ